MNTTCEATSFSIQLGEGRAEMLGEGIFGIIQENPRLRGKPEQVVILTREDLEAMLARA